MHTRAETTLGSSMEEDHRALQTEMRAYRNSLSEEEAVAFDGVSILIKRV
jgi:hypothetical protein